MIKALVRLSDAQGIPVPCRFGVFLTDDRREPTTKPSGKSRDLMQATLGA